MRRRSCNQATMGPEDSPELLGRFFMTHVSKVALIAAISLLLGNGAAMAADLMAPPPPEAAMTGNWTGGYVGVTGQYLRVEGVDESLAEGGVTFGADFQTGMFL